MTDLTHLQTKVDQHDRDILIMQEQTKETLMCLREVVQSIQGLTLNLQRYIDKHDRVQADQDKMAEKLSKLESSIVNINQSLARSESIIELVKSIYTKLTWSSIIGFIGFVGIIGMYVIQMKGGG